ncbi:TPA: hypothetical protein R1719_001565, partial [Campylobacter lari]|nr:hypothetical protein [Campylobacter lari]
DCEAVFKEDLEELVEELRDKYKNKAPSIINMILKPFIRIYHLLIYRNPRLLFLFLWSLPKDQDGIKFIQRRQIANPVGTLKLIKDVFPNFIEEKKEIKKLLKSFSTTPLFNKPNHDNLEI